MDRLCQRLYAPVDVALLAYVRIVLGAILFWHFAQHLSGGWIGPLYVAPRFHFTYPGFDWIRPWPGIGMHAHFCALVALAACMTLGLFYRASAILLFVGFAYVFLLDRTRYHNHYYLIVLLCGILIFLPAQRGWSLDALRRPAIRTRVVPAWTVWLLRFQIGIVYVFSGLAKLDSDWLLHRQPMQIVLAGKADFPIVGRLFREEWMIALFSDGGLAFDLLVVPALLWRPTRGVAFAIAVAFHVLNALLFEIGIFPWLMIALTAVFFRPDWPRRLSGWLRGQRSGERKGTGTLAGPAFTGVAHVGREPVPFHPHAVRGQASAGSTARGPACKATLALLTGYVVVQLVIPLRHHLYPGHASWTEEGHHFAWRLMHRVKASRDVKFLATHPESGRTWAVDPRTYLDDDQLLKMSGHPGLILQFSHFLADELQRQGAGDVEIRALTAVSLNGRPLQPLVDPRVNLADEPRSLRPKPWIVPLGGY